MFAKLRAKTENLTKPMPKKLLLLLHITNTTYFQPPKNDPSSHNIC
jgi:hypothetical protein